MLEYHEIRPANAKILNSDGLIPRTVMLMAQSMKI